LVGVALNVTDEPAHIEVLVEVIATAGTTDGLTVIVIVFEVALAVVVQLALEVKIQVTTSPFTKVDVVNTLLLVPLGEPFTRHW
jgi:hypothetical protein